MSIFGKVGGLFMDLIEVFVIAMSVFIVVYLFVAQPHQVKGNSMFPTYKDGEYLLTDKITYKTRAPEKGDVIVFRSPQNEAFDFIKRVIAVPGDKVMVRGGEVFVNGKQLNEVYLPDDYTTKAGRYLSEGREVLVQPGTFIAIGDNRGHSSDSREWGPVPYDNIVGKALVRYWPPQVFGLVQDPVGVFD